MIIGMKGCKACAFRLLYALTTPLIKSADQGTLSRLLDFPKRVSCDANERRRAFPTSATIFSRQEVLHDECDGVAFGSGWKDHHAFASSAFIPRALPQPRAGQALPI